MKQQPEPGSKPENRFSRPGGTESDQVVSPGTSESASRVVVSVTISAGTSVLKHGRVMRRRTSLRRRVSTGAAKLRRIKRRASALTRRDGSGTRIHDPKLVRADGVDVGDAAGVLAVTGASLRSDPHLDVVTVDETHVVEVLAKDACSDGELGQSGRRNSAADAFEDAAAVSGDAVAVAGGIEAAAGARPEPA